MPQAPSPIARWRREIRLTQTQVAQRMRCSRQYISDLECRRRPAGLRTLSRLARAMYCKVSDIMEKEDADEAAAL